ncbi:ABA4-like family protein [Aestuariivirga litoralis]|nr:ABA4-like family protein [Aestuariivirga litoralis]
MPETVFSLAGYLAMGGWLALVLGIVLDKPLLRDRIAGLWIPLILASAYSVAIAVFWWDAEGSFDSLAGVQQLFTWPWVALAGWVHYLAYDLFIGALMSRRIMEAKINRLVLVPILPLAFMFGPIGFVMAQALLLTRRENNA